MIPLTEARARCITAILEPEDPHPATCASLWLGDRSDPPEAEPSSAFTGSLRSYQRQGLGWLRRLGAQELGGALCDEMGLGKTVQIYFTETFVDPERNPGTCYRAANWTPLGLTKGRGKDVHTKERNRSLKLLFGYPLVHNFQERLRASGAVGNGFERATFGLGARRSMNRAISKPDLTLPSHGCHCLAYSGSGDPSTTHDRLKR